MPFSTSLWMMNGLKSSTAIALGRPHWCSRSSGPTTMTEPAGVVHPLAEQVLAEAALLALEHIGERLERALAATANCLGAASVVEECVHGLLEHPLLVPEDDLGRAMLDQLLEPVVPVDHPAVQVVQVGGREAAAVQGHQGPQVRRQHRDHVHDHPGRVVGQILVLARVQEGVHDLEPLEHLLLAVLAGLGGHRGAQLIGQLLDVDALQQRPHRRRADVGAEPGVALFPGLGAQGEVLLLIEQLLEFHLLLAGIDDDVARVVDDPLELPQRDVEQVAHRAGQRLEEPDVRHRHAELDVAHALAPHLGQRDLDAAAVADHAAIADPLVLAAVALPVLDRTEDALAEEAVPLRLEGAVVDGLGLGDLAPGPPGAQPLELHALPFLRIAGPRISSGAARRIAM
jgi:hypothetical protein